MTLGDKISQSLEPAASGWVPPVCAQVRAKRVAGGPNGSETRSASTGHEVCAQPLLLNPQSRGSHAGSSAKVQTPASDAKAACFVPQVDLAKVRRKSYPFHSSETTWKMPAQVYPLYQSLHRLSRSSLFQTFPSLALLTSV